MVRIKAVEILLKKKLNSSSAPAPRGACKRDTALPLGQRSRELKQHMISAPTLGAAGVGLGQHHEHETPPAPHCHHDLILLLLLLHLLALGPCAPAVTRLLHLHFIVTCSSQHQNKISATISHVAKTE
jgi:hypothetical protein